MQPNATAEKEIDAATVIGMLHGVLDCHGETRGPCGVCKAKIRTAIAFIERDKAEELANQPANVAKRVAKPASEAVAEPDGSTDGKRCPACNLGGQWRMVVPAYPDGFCVRCNRAVESIAQPPADEPERQAVDRVVVEGTLLSAKRLAEIRERASHFTLDDPLDAWYERNRERSELVAHIDELNATNRRQADRIGELVATVERLEAKNTQLTGSAVVERMLELQATVERLEAELRAFERLIETGGRTSLPEPPDAASAKGGEG